jgi:hypothetical protein
MTQSAVAADLVEQAQQVRREERDDESDCESL